MKFCTETPARQVLTHPKLLTILMHHSCILRASPSTVVPTEAKPAEPVPRADPDGKYLYATKVGRENPQESPADSGQACERWARSACFRTTLPYCSLIRRCGGLSSLPC